MRVLKGILAIFAAALVGGVILGSCVLDFVLPFTGFSMNSVWTVWACCGAVSGALAGYLYFTAPK